MGGKRPPGALFAAVLLAALAAAAVILIVRAVGPGADELHLVPRPVPASASPELPGAAGAGVGWSQERDATAAARQALRAALGAEPRQKPHTLFVFATDPSPLGPAVAEFQHQLGAEIRIYGGTSDEKGLLTQRGLLKQGAGDPPALAVMAISTGEVTVGVGTSAFAAFPSFDDAARAAATQARLSAGRSPAERPSALLLASTGENVKQGDLLAGIESVFGQDTPILGARLGAVILGDGVPGEGLAVAALYTELPFGWTFEGGYNVSGGRSGLITRMEGAQRLLEIDGRPALDVYDEWLGGELHRLYREHPAAEANDLLALYPFYVRHRSPRGEVYSIFSHVWPTDPTLHGRSLELGTKMRLGERVHLASGTWETLLNRVANLPRSARQRGDIEHSRALLGFGYVCSGVMAVIPARERPKAPLLMSQRQGGGPFLAVVSWGEHGYLPGVGNEFGNLLSSYLVIGRGPDTTADATPPREP